jgi:hypothetical protein
VRNNLYTGIIFSLLMTASAAFGGTIVMGGNDANNVFPWAYYGAGHEYQQAYSGIAGGTVINDISFSSFGGGSPYDLNVTIALSSSSILTTDYASNKGADFQTVFAGIAHFVPDGIGPENDGFDSVFHLANPFVFNSSLGSRLLMDVIMLSNPNSTSTIFHAGYNDPRTMRVFDLSGTGAATIDNLTLLTKLTTGDPAPEPGTWGMVVGTIMIMGTVRSRKYLARRHLRLAKG